MYFSNPNFSILRRQSFRMSHQRHRLTWIFFHISLRNFTPPIRPNISLWKIPSSWGKNSICQAGPPARISPPSPVPTGAESKFNLYLWILSRACSLARKPKFTLASGAHIAHCRSRLLLPFFSEAAQYDENGEITGVYFRESSWFSSSWLTAPVCLRDRRGNQIG